MIHYLTDYLLERRIKRAFEKFAQTRTTADWAAASKLVRQRSARQIARMEKAKGLA